MPATNHLDATKYLEDNYNLTHTVTHFSFAEHGVFATNMGSNNNINNNKNEKNEKNNKKDINNNNNNNDNNTTSSYPPFWWLNRTVLTSSSSSNSNINLNSNLNYNYNYNSFSSYSNNNILRHKRRDGLRRLLEERSAGIDLALPLDRATVVQGLI